MKRMLLAMVGTLALTGHAGANKLTFNGHINRHTKIRRGTYTVTIKAGASTRRLTFTILN